MRQLEQVNAWSSRQPARLQSLPSKRNGFPVTLIKFPSERLPLPRHWDIDATAARLEDSRSPLGYGLGDTVGG